MLIIAHKSGQLGNRLMLFAYFIAFAREYQLSVIYPAFEEYAHFFKGTQNSYLCRFPVSPVKLPIFPRLRTYCFNQINALVERKIIDSVEITREKPFNWSDSSISSIAQAKRLLAFKGWLFRDGWFVKDLPLLRQHSSYIRDYLTPSDSYLEAAHLSVAKLRSRVDQVVGVHIRQGDYNQHQEGRYFYDTEDYIKIIQGLSETFAGKSLGFLICSNEQQDLSSLENVDYVCGPGHLIEDMYALSFCDYILGPPSSFTMWASFYGGTPLYMIRDRNYLPSPKDFVQFYDWKGEFHAHDDWSKGYWAWTH